MENTIESGSVVNQQEVQMDGVAQQQQQQQQQYMGASPFDTYNTSIALLTSPDSDLRELELNLKNCIEDQDGNVISRKTGEAMLNEEGVSAMIGIVRSFASRNVILGYYEEKQINRHLQRFGRIIVTDLLTNGYRYKIQDNSTKSRILWMVLWGAFTCMQRGLKEGDRKFWKSNYQEIRHDTNAPQAKKGFFGKIMGGS